jgi:hypothetical protein
MSLAKLSTALLAISFIASCAPEPPPQKTIFDPMLQQKQKAKDVQNTMDANSDATRKAVDAQERGDSSQ